MLLKQHNIPLTQIKKGCHKWHGMICERETKRETVDKSSYQDLICRFDMHTENTIKHTSPSAKPRIHIKRQNFV